MPEPKGNDVQRTLAVRVTPDYHAQLVMAAQIDDISLTDLMMAALDTYMASRREAPDFQAKAAKALEDAEAQIARTRADAARHCRKALRARQTLRLRAGLGARMRLPADAGS
jgi:uncharacterized protein (DUF1778 family)